MTTFALKGARARGARFRLAKLDVGGTVYGDTNY